MEKVIQPMKNILLVSVFITNKSLNPSGNIGHSRTGSPFERLEIFLTSLRSWSRLGLDDCYFFIELDEDFVEYRNLIALEIESNFIDPHVKWHRLLYFQDWSAISSILLGQRPDLITLMANDDHSYVHADPQSFQDFCWEILELSQKNQGRGLGDLTHFPGPIRTLAFNSTFGTKKGDSKRSLIATTIHGTCVVTPNLFGEWWEEDFTEGKRIPRPDNPFGPSVEFAPANVLIPSVEIHRHLDGIGCGTRISRKYNVLRPSCRIFENEPSGRGIEAWKVVESQWSYGLWPNTPYSHDKNSNVDLYRMFPVTNSAMERFRVDMSRLIIAFQEVFQPRLSREFILNRDSSFLYVSALNFAILLDFSTFFNFLVWALFDLPNEIAIRLSIKFLGVDSRIVKLLLKVRNRILQHMTVRILKHSRLFSNSYP
jgi:hypothetical protein